MMVGMNPPLKVANEVISWNVRGINAPNKQRLVKNLMRDNQPDVFLIHETKLNSLAWGATKHSIWKKDKVVK